MPVQVVGNVAYPDVRGMDQATAEATLAALQVFWTYADPAYSSTVAQDLILTQSPDPDITSEINPDPAVTTVTLTVSLGTEPPLELEDGGLNSRPRKRYYVEIDHQRFEVTSPSHAQALLDRAKEVAQAHAQELAEKAVQRKRKPSKKPVPLPTPQISSPNPELKGVIRDARTQINEVYRQAAMQAELALLFAQRLAEEDEEETLLLLM